MEIIKSPFPLLIEEQHIPLILSSNQAVSFHLEKCKKPLLENGFFYGTEMSFKIHEKLQYKCNLGYHTPNGGTEDTVQCQADGWSSQPSCTKNFGRIVHFPPYNFYIYKILLSLLCLCCQIANVMTLGCSSSKFSPVRRAMKFSDFTHWLFSQLA